MMKRGTPAQKLPNTKTNNYHTADLNCRRHYTTKSQLRHFMQRKLQTNGKHQKNNSKI